MDFTKNPFAETDTDRHQIWAMLVERDIDAYDEAIPLDRLLIETDCPFLTPVPYRGKTRT